ncbi:MAG TPA: uroporphyrinogen decarboxylase, partial [Synergistaceae bacterium]|nr:uroporphyrinogen decarboxylase [Synergistaceae bacterium]
TGRERVLQALRFQETDRVPWVPFTGAHVARLVNSDAETMLKNADVLVDAVAASAERYLADGVCSAFDLQAEAEALGCTLTWSKKNPPAVTGHVLAQGKTLDDLPPFTRESGRLPMFFEATRKLVERVGHDTAVFALCCGPFTLALHLRGSAFIMDMMKRPDEAHKVLAFCAEIIRRMGEWYMETGAHVIAVVDPMTSQIAPKHFEAFVTPYVKPVIDEVRGKGGIVTLFCCGNATKNIELMMQCAPDAVAFDEQVDLAFVRDLAHKYKVCFEGNIPLTTTLLFGSPKECVADVKNRIAIGGRQGYILSPGCDLPYDTPFYNLEAVGRYAVLGEEPSDTAGFLSLEEALAQASESGDVLEDVAI